MTIPRPEHPRPQFERADWINLNGPWTCEFDFGLSGIDRKRFESDGFDTPITVPFCPESTLSGIAHHDFIPAIWYHRTITIPHDWDGRCIRLHCGGIDYESTIYIDGTFVGRHFGGSASFSVPLTPHVKPGGSHALVIHAIDDTRSDNQPCGKQSQGYYSRGCSYTRVTGIWQTVWLEAHAATALQDAQYLTDIDNGTVTIVPRYYATPERGTRLTATLTDASGDVASTTCSATPTGALQLTLTDPTLWSPQCPHLYDLKLELVRGGDVIDCVSSYVGMRKIHCEGARVYLNNEPLYQRLVLDQGFYKTGIWTAPTDADLKRDIELSQAAGFNGARLHQKAFEERFHYWADKLGYLTWAESPSWGIRYNEPEPQRYFLTEWGELVMRDRNHPSIITWTPLNETSTTDRPTQHRRFHVDLYDLTRALDPTRPVNDASGYLHQKTDLWTVHNYEQDPAKLKEQLTPSETDGVYRNIPAREVAYEGQPYLVDEFGGIRWVEIDETEFSNQAAWGYGEAPTSLEQLYDRLEGMVDALLSLDHVSGYCYTQLTDIEQEQNGIYNYDRSAKFDMTRIRQIFTRQP